jgi:hypothetical protein
MTMEISALSSYGKATKEYVCSHRLWSCVVWVASMLPCSHAANCKFDSKAPKYSGSSTAWSYAA